MAAIHHIERSDGIVRLYVRRATDLLGPLQKIVSRDRSVRVRIAPVSLESLFLHLTSEEAVQ